MRCRRVAQQVRADLLGGQRRCLPGGFLRATRDQLADAGAGDRPPQPTEEDRLPGSAPLDELRERSCRGAQQRTQARLATLAPQGDERVARAVVSQLQVPDGQLGRLGRSSSGVVEEQEQGALAPALWRGSVRGIE